jgi:hypothetical protein
MPALGKSATRVGDTTSLLQLGLLRYITVMNARKATCGPRPAVKLIGLLLAAPSCRTANTAQGTSAFLEIPASGTGQRAGLWRPDGAVVLHVRAWCVGEYVSQVCTIELTDLSDADAGARVLFRDNVGQTLPSFGLDTDRLILVLVGEDGRGAWRQMLRFTPAGRTFQWSRRRYDDGMG